MSRPPNILFIMTDQQRFDCVSANGNAVIQTPNLDALAADAANFSHCFVQAPVCVPSRQTFFTGRYPHSHRNRVNYTPLKADERLMQSRLQALGYHTACVGKLHYYPPTNAHAVSTGFDRVLLHDAGPCDAHSDYVKWLRAAAPEYVPDYRQTRGDAKNPFIACLPDELHETTWCGRQTREVLRECAKQDQPFFLFSSFWKPHASFEVPEPWASLYADADIPLPPRTEAADIERYPLPVQKMICRSPREQEAPDAQRLWAYRAYYAAVTQIDREVGLTLEALDELGLQDNTVVIFTSDHGDQLYEHGMLGKNVFFEGSLRIPFMIRHASVLAGQYDDLVESTDVLPTLFELCGLPVPDSNQGRSFAGLLTQGATGSPYALREFVFAENCIPEVITGGQFDNAYTKGQGVVGVLHPDAKCVRSRSWKYNYYVGYGEELYHLDQDPEEQYNLALDPAAAEQKERMRCALLDWLITADEADQIAPRWCDV